MHRLVDQVYYQPCTRCGRPIIPIPVPVLALLYGSRLPEEIATLNRLCEKCRSRKQVNISKMGKPAKKLEAKE